MKKRAQSTLEYAVIIVCVVAALVAMQIYIKRALSGQLRQIGDEIGQQYEPTKTTGTITTSIDRNTTASTQLFGIDKYGNKISFSGTKALDVNNEVKYFVTERTDTLNKEETKRWGEETVEKF